VNGLPNPRNGDIDGRVKGEAMQTRLIIYCIYLATFFTGGAGLVFQVTWQRYLSRLLGSDNIATAVILATFLAGLSGGYYLCGLITTRVRNHLKGYAVLEVTIGAWCLCFPSFFDWVEGWTQSWQFSPPFFIVVQGLFCSFLLMGIPTLCMGGTVPFLTRGLSESLEASTRVHAAIYAVNTGGAFVGTLTAGFILIPFIGLPLSIMGTALINLGAGLFFYIASHLFVPENQGTSQADAIIEGAGRSAEDRRKLPIKRLYLIAFLSGFYVMTLENVLIRMTNLSLGSSSYSFSIIVSVFILSIAAGSFIFGKLRRPPAWLLFANQLVITISLLLVFLTLDLWPYGAHLIRIIYQANTAGFYAFHASTLIALALILILPVGCMGATVPIIFDESKRWLSGVGKMSGTLFSFNAMGNLCGSLIGGILLFHFFDLPVVFMAAVAAAAISTLIACRRHFSKRIIAAAGLAAALLGYGFSSAFYDTTRTQLGTFRIRQPLPYSWKGPKAFFDQFGKAGRIVFHTDGPASTVVVLGSKKPEPTQRDPLALIINGKSDSSVTQDAETLKLLAHLPALLSRDLSRVMVIGLGTGMTAGEFTLYPEVNRIDIAEISPSVVEALPYFSDFNRNVLDDPRTHIQVGDAFRVLGRSSRQWDIITAEPSNPWVTGVDLLYTQEFYQLVKKHLTATGVFVQWIHAYAANPQMIGMAVNTILSIFPQSHVFLSRARDLVIVSTKNGISQHDLDNARTRLNRLIDVKKSLRDVGMPSVSSILLREIWSPSHLKERFRGYGLQTMDNPRLHYLAGQCFFRGDAVPPQFLLPHETAVHAEEYLLTRLNKNNPAEPLDVRRLKVLDRLLEHKKEPVFRMMAESLALKARFMTSSPSPLPDEVNQHPDIKLLPLIMENAGITKIWKNAGLGKTGYRTRCEALINHMVRRRNWIAPYPIAGLKALLEEGIGRGKDNAERNWCAVQRARLALQENEGMDRVRFFLSRAGKTVDVDLTPFSQNLPGGAW